MIKISPQRNIMQAENMMTLAGNTAITGNMMMMMTTLKKKQVRSNNSENTPSEDRGDIIIIKGQGDIWKITRYLKNHPCKKIKAHCSSSAGSG